MAHKPTEENLEALREDTYRALSSGVEDLISALQKREVERARRIASRLHEHLRLCGSDRPSYFLAQILMLLSGDDVFQHCDELSERLLALEHELGRMRTSRCGGPLDSPLSRDIDDERAVYSGQLNLPLAQGTDRIRRTWTDVAKPKRDR